MSETLVWLLRSAPMRALPVQSNNTKVSATWTKSGSRTEASDMCVLPFRFRCDPHHDLAEVLALEQADERARRVLEALHNVLAVCDPALLQPGRGLAQKLGLLGEEIADDEASQREPLRQHGARSEERRVGK